MKKVKDGWHTITGYDVFVEDGRVVRGTAGSGYNLHTVYPYRYNRGLRCWVNVSRQISVDALRAGIRRETMGMF